MKPSTDGLPHGLTDRPVREAPQQENRDASATSQTLNNALSQMQQDGALRAEQVASLLNSSELVNDLNGQLQTDLFSAPVLKWTI